jgi:hypothetical protein
VTVCATGFRACIKALRGRDEEMMWDAEELTSGLETIRKLQRECPVSYLRVIGLAHKNYRTLVKHPLPSGKTLGVFAKRALGVFAKRAAIKQSKNDQALNKERTFQRTQPNAFGFHHSSRKSAQWPPHRRTPRRFLQDTGFRSCSPVRSQPAVRADCSSFGGSDLNR